MLGADVAVLELSRLVLTQDDDSASVVCQSIEHVGQYGTQPLDLGRVNCVMATALDAELFRKPARPRRRLRRRAVSRHRGDRWPATDPDRGMKMAFAAAVRGRA